MVNFIDERRCTGCMLCHDICPNDAIYFKTDEKGFWYPNIDLDKCNGCGLCESMCPSSNAIMIEGSRAPIVYAAWSRQSKIRYESTSGGVFWEIASEFIRLGGSVAGCRWGYDWKSAYHTIAHTEDELIHLRGSKYIQSDTSGIYTSVQKEINEGKKVLFCGTPCQNAALKKLIGENDNLFLMDFICRNVNSPLAFRKYIEEKEQQVGAHVSRVRLKDKELGWESLASRVEFENGEVSLEDRSTDTWINGFICSDLYTRLSCTECSYRMLPRITSDITVGDFWGIRGETGYDMYRGISVVLLNTQKGESLFRGSSQNLHFVKKSLEDVIPGNPALLKQPIINENQDYFFKAITKKSFSEAVFKYTNFRPEKSRIVSAQEEYEQDQRKYGDEIDEELYYWLNYDNPCIVRKGNARIIPYKNTIVDISPTARIVLEGNIDLEIGTNKLRGSKAETLIRLEADSLWNVKHGGYIFYGTTIELKNHARFDTGYFSANTGSVIIVAKKVTIGEDVMLGRNVIIYDSDFHEILDGNGNMSNAPKEVVIEEHVWLTGNITVNKGVVIGEGSIVASQTVVTKDVQKHNLITGKSGGSSIRNDVKWSRKLVRRFDEEFRSKKVILYGYGIEGKKFYNKYSDRIKHRVDNYSKEDGVVSFAEFSNIYPNLTDDYMWVIASPNHYDELYADIREKYIEILIVSFTEVG